MVIYSCEKCGKTFKQKGHYMKHLQRKIPCDNIKDKIENIVEKKVDELVKEKLQDLVDKGEIEIKNIENKNKNLISNDTNINQKDTNIKMDYQMSYIDLFCGIGGFHQALNRFNCECILACDIDKACRENYKLNYDIEVHPDVKKINPEEIIEDIDIICGGFPCQAFSNAGKKKTFEDDRGLLFDEIMKIAKIKKPKFMFLENVKHILKVGDKKVIEYIKQKIDDYGYHLQIFQISPHQYGVPQQRERVYFVCVRKDIYNGSDIILPPKVDDFKFEDFLYKKEDIDPKYFIDGDTLQVLNAWEEMIKIFPPGEKISPVIMIMNIIIIILKKSLIIMPNGEKDILQQINH